MAQQERTRYRGVKVTSLSTYLSLFHANVDRQSPQMQALDASKHRLLLLLLIKMMLPYGSFSCAVLSTPLELDIIFLY